MNDMVEVKVSELIGPALDYAVAYATKAWEWAHIFYPTMTLDSTFCAIRPGLFPRGEYGSMLMTCVLVPNNPFRQDPQPFCPSTDWSQGGPLISDHLVTVGSDSGNNRIIYWAYAGVAEDGFPCAEGGTHLIAACRAIVAAKIGDTVSVPKELMP